MQNGTALDKLHNSSDTRCERNLSKSGKATNRVGHPACLVGKDRYHCRNLSQPTPQRGGAHRPPARSLGAATALQPGYSLHPHLPRNDRSHPKESPKQLHRKASSPYQAGPVVSCASHLPVWEVDRASLFLITVCA